MVARCSIMLAVGSVALGAFLPLLAADEAAVKKVQAWRAQHETDYRRDWVPLAGLFVLKPGVNTVGSAAGRDVRLPNRVPGSIGQFVFEKNRVRFEPIRLAGARSGQARDGLAGAPSAQAAEWPVTLKGQAVSAPIEAWADPAAPRIELAVGDITFWVHYSGDRRFIRMRDPQAIKPSRSRGSAGSR